MIEDVLESPTTEYNTIGRAPVQPVLGDVIDALDDAAASLKLLARNEAQIMMHNVRTGIRARPIKVVALVAAAAFLLGRLAR